MWKSRGLVGNIWALFEGKKPVGMDAELTMLREERPSFAGGCEGRDTGHIPFYLSQGCL